MYRSIKSSIALIGFSCLLSVAAGAQTVDTEAMHSPLWPELSTLSETQRPIAEQMLSELALNSFNDFRLHLATLPPPAQLDFLRDDALLQPQANLTRWHEARTSNTFGWSQGYLDQQRFVGLLLHWLRYTQTPAVLSSMTIRREPKNTVFDIMLPLQLAAGSDPFMQFLKIDFIRASASTAMWYDFESRIASIARQVKSNIQHMRHKHDSGDARALLVKPQVLIFIEVPNGINLPSDFAAQVDMKIRNYMHDGNDARALRYIAFMLLDHNDPDPRWQQLGKLKLLQSYDFYGKDSAQVICSRSNALNYLLGDRHYYQPWHDGLALDWDAVRNSKLTLQALLPYDPVWARTEVSLSTRPIDDLVKQNIPAEELSSQARGWLRGIAVSYGRALRLYAQVTSSPQKITPKQLQTYTQHIAQLSIVVFRLINHFQNPTAQLAVYHQLQWNSDMVSHFHLCLLATLQLSYRERQRILLLLSHLNVNIEKLQRISVVRRNPVPGPWQNEVWQRFSARHTRRNISTPDGEITAIQTLSVQMPSDILTASTPYFNCLQQASMVFLGAEALPAAPFGLRLPALNR